MGDMSVAQVYSDYMGNVSILLRSMSPVIIVSLALFLVGVFVDLAHSSTAVSIPFVGSVYMKYRSLGASPGKVKKLNKKIDSDAAKGEGFVVKDRKTREVISKSS